MAIAVQLTITCVQQCTMGVEQYNTVQRSESTWLFGLRVISFRVVGETLSRTSIKYNRQVCLHRGFRYLLLCTCSTLFRLSLLSIGRGCSLHRQAVTLSPLVQSVVSLCHYQDCQTSRERL